MSIYAEALSTYPFSHWQRNITQGCPQADDFTLRRLHFTPTMCHLTATLLSTLTFGPGSSKSWTSAAQVCSSAVRMRALQRVPEDSESPNQQQH